MVPAPVRGPVTGHGERPPRFSVSSVAGDLRLHMARPVISRYRWRRASVRGRRLPPAAAQAHGGQQEPQGHLFHGAHLPFRKAFRYPNIYLSVTPLPPAAAAGMRSSRSDGVMPHRPTSRAARSPARPWSHTAAQQASIGARPPGPSRAHDASPSARRRCRPWPCRSCRWSSPVRRPSGAAMTVPVALEHQIHPVGRAAKSAAACSLPRDKPPPDPERILPHGASAP